MSIAWSEVQPRSDQWPVVRSQKSEFPEPQKFDPFFNDMKTLMTLTVEPIIDAKREQARGSRKRSPLPSPCEAGRGRPAAAEGEMVFSAP
jgi:hypothetical protein